MRRIIRQGAQTPDTSAANIYPDYTETGPGIYVNQTYHESGAVPALSVTYEQFALRAIEYNLTDGSEGQALARLALLWAEDAPSGGELVEV